MSKSLPRRTVLKAALMGSAALPLVAKLTDAEAAAQPLVAANDPVGKTLGYEPDTTKVDAKANPTHKVTQKCANCVQFQGKPADKQGACNLFPGKDVLGNGWCKVWAQKPGT
ncbi:MAG: high-potential iron-sulfur protein [Steroidobacteraceae bacterium]